VSLRWAVDGWRRLVAVLIGYRGEALALRAGNLTFITITSLVPLAAVILALLHAFNQTRVEQLVMTFFEELLSPGGKLQSETTIRKFLAAAGSRTGSGLSFFVVMVSAGILLRHLDASLNDLWAVRRKRSIVASLLLYTGLLIVGPLLIGVTLAGTDGAKHLILWLDLPFSSEAFVLGAVLSACAVFTLLYKGAPHAHVPWSSALVGGTAAGVAWEIARRLYGSIASFFFSANPLYGSLGIAPLFLTWIYVGWYIVLSGARLSYAVEHADFHDEFKDLLAHPRSAELMAARIAEVVTRAELAHAPAPKVLELSAELRLPAQRLDDLCADLVAAGLLAQTPQGGLKPGRDPAHLTLADLSAALGGAASLVRRERSSRTGQFEALARRYLEIDDASVEKLRQITWVELAATPPSK
jgi:membrane protein